MACLLVDSNGIVCWDYEVYQARPSLPSLTFLEGGVMVWLDKLGVEHLMATKKALLLKLVGHAACEGSTNRNILRVSTLVAEAGRHGLECADEIN